jgi:hypothetical protein
LQFSRAKEQEEGPKQFNQMNQDAAINKLKAKENTHARHKKKNISYKLTSGT